MDKLGMKGGGGPWPKLLGPPEWMSRGGSEAQADAYAYDHPDQTTAGPSVSTLAMSHPWYVLFPTRIVIPVCKICRFFFAKSFCIVHFALFIFGYVFFYGLLLIEILPNNTVNDKLILFY